MARMLGLLNCYDHYCYRCGHKLKSKTRRAQRQKERRAWSRDQEI
jgi:hypothetical protein